MQGGGCKPSIGGLLPIQSIRFICCSEQTPANALQSSSVIVPILPRSHFRKSLAAFLFRIDGSVFHSQKITLYVLKVPPEKCFFLFFLVKDKIINLSRLSSVKHVLLKATVVVAVYCGPFNQTDEKT